MTKKIPSVQRRLQSDQILPQLPELSQETEHYLRLSLDNLSEPFEEKVNRMLFENDVYEINHIECFFVTTGYKC